jgi:Uncharacterized protein conserved in bacteria (DUF2252)
MAHLGNFRCFATPERRVIFDIHDLDETLPAPWEWDVKRLAASFVLACRTNGFSDKLACEVVQTCVRSYRKAMAQFGTMRALEVWYARFEAEHLQLRDMKLKFRIEQFNSAKMVIFGEWCGGTLARAHARSGEPALISGYLGKVDTFDQAIAAFAVAYADQVERDYESFTKAVRAGKLEARMDDDA